MVTDTQISSEAVCRYFDALDHFLNGLTVTDKAGAALAPNDGLGRAGAAVRRAAEATQTVFIVGNGGSAAVASQMAYDFTYNRSIRALGFGDGSILTGISADHGYHEVFARQIAAHGRCGDHLIAISSSGQSPNILNAIASARAKGLGVLTMSGFNADNPVRQTGDLNFYIASGDYGFVEVSHLTLCHAILDHSALSS
jgi:D-sedoheptulose 7-phosphate isomerase